MFFSGQFAEWETLGFQRALEAHSPRLWLLSHEEIPSADEERHFSLRKRSNPVNVAHDVVDEITVSEKGPIAVGWILYQCVRIVCQVRSNHIEKLYVCVFVSKRNLSWHWPDAQFPLSICALL